ncbi:MAG: 5-oxoprolinase subunit PxpB [Burkholderiaceae bacterium]|nr:5-oxoprolinase subunit PxpB [Burkholderiaceae bacterium]
MSTADPVRLLPLGDSAVTLQFGTEIGAAANARVLGFCRALADAVQRGELPGVVEWVPAYASVTVHAEDIDEQAAAERDARLLALAEGAAPLQTAGRRWRLPACFDERHSPDLRALAEARGTSVAEAIDLIVGTTFRVYMLGFLPGFAYLGDLPAALEMPRLATPRREVPERSIAVAGRMCAVYPWASPGGWHLIGRTPVRLFDAAADEPALLASGDEVVWQPVDAAAYDALDRRAAAAQLPRSELLAGNA